MTQRQLLKETNSQEIVDSVSIDGAVYGVPFTTNTWFMYYDKSVFSDDDVKSLDTMLEKGKVSFKLTDSWYIASFYVANGCTLFGEDGTDEAAGVDFSGDKGTQVTDYLVDLVANQISQTMLMDLAFPVFVMVLSMQSSQDPGMQQQ